MQRQMQRPHTHPARPLPAKRMHPVLRFLLPALPLALAACDSVMGPPLVRRVGILEWRMSVSPADPEAPSPFGPAVTAPDTVEAGVPFTIRVTTIGPSLCWRAAGAEVEQGAARAVVTPFDWTPESEEIGCADAVTHLPREVRLRFARRGDALLRVEGRRVVGRTLADTERVRVERRIHVR
jgi:hypothetical protein